MFAPNLFANRLFAYWPVSALVILVLLVGACGSGEPDAVDLDAMDEQFILSYPEDFAIDTSEDEIVARWGEPDSIEEIAIEGTGDGESQDVRRIYSYNGLQFIFYESVRQDFHILAATVLESRTYAIDLGLQVGMSRTAAEETLGSPDFVQDTAYVYSYGDTPTDRLNIELIINDDIVREIAVSPDMP